MRRYCVFVVQLLVLISLCSCELSVETRDKFVNGFIDYLNNLPNQAFVFEEGALVKSEQVADNCYKIEVNIKASDLHNVDSFKQLYCTTTLLDLGEIGISVPRNEYQCVVTPGETTVTAGAVTEGVTTEAVVERRPVQLDNEIQSGNYITSGEQFIAIPRDHPAPCIGCSTKIDPQADGVTDLATLCVLHIDRHEPNVRHTLVSVLGVERQVQVVNGVRYILTMTVDFNTCTDTETEGCNLEKICKISVLEKPWVRLSDGSKYRAILANNCTQQWLFDDNGEVLQLNNDNNKENNEINVNPFNNNDRIDETNDTPNPPTPDYDKIANTGSVDDILKVVHNTNLQAQPHQEQGLTEEQLRNLQEQIIPLDRFKQYSHDIYEVHQNDPRETIKTEKSHSIDNVETEKHVSDTALPIGQPTEKEIQVNPLPEDKRKAIDELMNLFDFPVVDSKIEKTIKKRHIPELKINARRFLDEVENRKKRGLVGGPSDADPKDPKYKTLAEESLNKYLQTSGNNNPHKVMKITKVTTQVVSGSLTHIYFKVTELDKAQGDAFDCHSKIWEQPWRNKKDITVDCEDNKNKSRKKRQIPGGVSEVDTKDPKYKTLAEESLNKYLLTSGNNKPHKVMEITKVTTQVVSGSLTHIYFIVTPVDKAQGDAFDCHAKIWEQSWLNKKDITVDCEDKNKSRKKRQIPGGVSEVDTKDPKYKTLAEECLNKYLLTSGNNNPHKVVEITKITTQVVSGSLTHIYFKVTPVDKAQGDAFDCHAKIWEQSWLNKKDITVDCEDNIKKSRKKRQIPGGVSEVDTKDPKYKTLAEESLNKYLLTSGNNKPHKVMEITKVTTQVVSGSLTHIYFIVTPVDKAQGDAFDCHAKIWEQSWLNKKDITVDCEDKNKSRKKRQIPGGVSEVDTKDPKYKTLAEESLNKYLLTSGNNKPHKVMEITKVTTQVVSGSLTHIYFIVTPVDKAQGDAFDCHAKIWEQSWLNKKDITVDCEDKNKSRKKRQIPGGVSEVDTKDPKYKTLAEESLNKYLLTSGNNKPHKVMEITKVTTQVVSGSLTHIYFIVTPVDKAQGDAFDCHAKIWEQSWLNKKDITVDCEDNKDKSRTKRQILGGVKEVDTKDPKYETLAEESLQKRGAVRKEDPSNPKYKNLAEESLAKYLETSENNFHHKVFDVRNVTLQIVAGTLTRIDFRAFPTNCERDKNVSSIDCEVHGDGIDCHSEIWEQVWLNKKEITVNCSVAEPNKLKVKRKTLIGGPIQKNATDPKYIKLAKESLAKFLETSGSYQPYHVVDVINVTVQIVAGKLTKIDFRVSSTDKPSFQFDAFHCHAEVWERLWLDSKEITVTCDINEVTRKNRDVSSSVKKNIESTSEYKTLAEEQEKRHVDVQPFFGETISNFNVESAENARGLAEEGLKHIEAKYPHPRRQKVVRVFSLQKQAVAGLHYRLKLEVGSTDCMALSVKSDCKLVNDSGPNRFCRVNIWIRPGSDHPPTYRVACDNQEERISQMYHHIQAQELFKDFISTYKPHYMNDDMQMAKRFEIFKTNVRRIHDLNTYERGTGRYGVTRFADLSAGEFRSRHLGLDVSLRDRNAVPLRHADIPTLELPDQFDWRDSGAVTEVKNQGSCGSCWAFSVTGNIEGQWKRRSGKLVSLSEQELVDCDTLDKGCDGGLPDNAYRAIEQLGGLELESDYPYEGEDDKCAFNRTLSRVQISGAVNISSNESDMAKWLVGNGPISIGINANAMQFYVGGISHPWKMLCNPKNLDHGVLIVGYGAKDYPLFHKHLPYWIVKNSWGASWGEQGYYRVYRGDGTCGVNMMASSAII